MEIFLVRHGQTGGNVAHRHQAEHTPLSMIGKEQARKVGETLKQYEPTHLLSSNLVRTVETAGIIGQACELVSDTSPHLIELVRPDALYGYRHRSLKSIWFFLQWYFGKSVEGESYRDLLLRFELAKKVIEEYPQDARLVVVSHSVFISLFVAHLCQTKKLSLLKAAKVFHKILTMPNTHVTHLRFNEVKKAGECAWSLVQKA